MSWKLIKQIEEQAAAKKQEMRSILTLSETEKRDLKPEESTRFDALNSEMESLNTRAAQYKLAYAQPTGQQNEQRIGRDDLYTPEQQSDQQAKEYRDQFTNWIRTGNVPMENRSLTVTGLGVVGDRPFFTKIIESLKSYTGVLEAGALVLPTSTGNPITVPCFDDTANTGRQVGEGVPNANATDPTPANKTLASYKYESDWVKISTELLTDAAFDVEGFIIQMGNRRIGRKFNSATTTGTGVGMPLGCITGATLGKTAVANNAITYDEFIDFQHSLDSAYRNSGKCKIMLHDLTLAALRKLKDAAGRYIWQPGGNGVAANIDGFGYVINNDMATLSSGASSIVAAIGDFSYYFVRQVAQPIVRRANELFISDGLIGFKIEQRLDGTLTDAKAVKTLKLGL